MRSIFTTTIATTLVAGLGACSSVKHNHDSPSLGDFSSDKESSLLEENPESEVAEPIQSPGSNSLQKTPHKKPSIASSQKESGLIDFDSGSSYASKGPSKSQSASVPQLPVVASSPFQSEGFWMNSFYFVRKGDSWEKISKTLYGRPDRVSLLKKWNPKLSAVPGTLLYYNSPSRPDDSQNMKVFAEDFAQPLEQVTVKDGESLYQIASHKFGSRLSWKEIAALNPMVSDPAHLNPGQILAMQPAHINTKAALKAIAEQAQLIKNGQDQGEQIAKEKAAESTDKSTNAPPEAKISENALNKIRNMDFKSKFKSKFPIVAGVLVIIGLLLAFTLRKRKHKFIDPYSTTIYDNQKSA